MSIFYFNKKAFFTLVALGTMCIVWLGLNHFGAFPYWIVYGKIENKYEKPLENANVTVHFGVAADSSMLSKKDGSFFLTTFVPIWSVCKGAKPSISVNKSGYGEYWTYFQQWSWGLKITKVTIQLNKETMK